MIPGLGRFLGEGNDNPLQYSCLENPWTEEPGGLYSPWVTRAGHNLSTKPPPQNILLLLAAGKFASFPSIGSTTLIVRVLSVCVGRASLFHGKETPQGRCFEQKVCCIAVAQQTLFGWVDGSCSGIYCS